MICDFGLSQIFIKDGSTGMTSPTVQTGTFRYLAPELVVTDQRPSSASDVWALGCIGLEACIRASFI
jgi:serine/threonine protein kinase